jgi:hypothetical protein
MTKKLREYLDHREFDGMLEKMPSQAAAVYFWESFWNCLHRRKQEAREQHEGQTSST